MNNTSFQDIKHLEPWEGYFRIRSREMEVFFGFFDNLRKGYLLDIGCGCGFVSGILAGKAKHVISLDLPTRDEKDHAVGIDIAKRLLDICRIDNVTLVGSRAEELPLKARSVDAAFLQYTLEHIPRQERPKALKEVHRVLKDGGYFLLILPTFLERFFGYLFYYFDLFIRLCKRPFRNKQGAFKTKDKGLRRQPIRSYFLPPIHGSYKSRSEELRSQFPHSWESLVKRSNFRIMETFTIRFIPFSTELTSRIYENTSIIARILGDKIPFKFFGKNYCIVCRKETKSL